MLKYFHYFGTLQPYSKQLLSPAAIGDELEGSFDMRIPLLYLQFLASGGRRKDRPKHVERFTRINNLR
jgi:hypothetical protein